MKKVYKAFSDAGHGWIQVPITELIRLGIADQITSYSYMFGNNAYLEEDCDYSTWLAAKNQHGEKYSFKEYNCGESRIRTYECFSFERYLKRPMGTVGEIVRYGKGVYRLVDNMGRRGWRVTCEHTGVNFRLPRAMFARSERVA
jgi:hypothetical protein